MVIVMMGPPGSGKGTQSEMLSYVYSIPIISTGVMLRDALKDGSRVGKYAKRYMQMGKLLPDHIIIELMKNKLKESEYHNGFILDGFPRTLAQVVELDLILKSELLEVDVVIQLEVFSPTLIQRINSRSKKENRIDDTREIIKNRLKVFEKETQPVINYYVKKNKLEKINGLGSVDEIHLRIVEKIDKYSKKLAKKK